MTSDSKLTANLRRLAEIAGYEVHEGSDVHARPWTAYSTVGAPRAEWNLIPKGVTQFNVGLVLSWLAKGGYYVSIWETRKQTPNVTRVTIADYLPVEISDPRRPGTQQDGDTLEAALTQAVEALELGEKR